MTIRYNQALVKQQPQPEHFSPQFWQQAGQQSGSAGGRNLAYFIQADNQLSELPMVLRHYYRGGLVGKVNRDWFMATQQPRNVAEYELLEWMHGQGLPVPRPIALLTTPKFGLCYQADILIERLPCDADMFTLLQQGPLASSMWQQIGQTIARMHQHGVYHSDLNCHNILLAVGGEEAEADKVWLIDFDKCERRKPGEWSDQNLARLRRSLDKEKGLHQGFHFTQKNWQSLVQGYEGRKE
ncbi:MAG: 3-deoxy-D-manno-octulosonic acid kinase [Idiomarina sp.]|nr:3-deoxy-D-manno-octulosonic acid kinase [Idiomarina sp.]